MDQYLRFVNGVQALRRRTSAMGVGLCGALGVAADPLPHQLATVRRVLGDIQVRHLLSDEVGLGKTVQALMIMNALRWQDPKHRTLVVVPGNLLSQWQEECWIRGHVMPALAGEIIDTVDESAPITLARPRDLMARPGEDERTIRADPSVFDLLIVDEPQTMPREVVRHLSQVSDGFRQVLVLSATPKLGDPAWRELILRMIEPQAAQRARLKGRKLDEVLAEREKQAIATAGNHADASRLSVEFSRAAAGRRVIRNGRDKWGAYLPVRRNNVIRVQPLRHERLRHEIAATLLESAQSESDLQGSVWTAARALQRSARAARTVLAELAAHGGRLGEQAERARQASLENPGDSRLEVLLDILANRWSEDQAQAFIVVCGDNPTIDMLRAALPRYFPDLDGRISILRRPSSTEADGVANLRKTQETLAPLLSGENRLLLIGDWVQAGLNLHHVAHGIIFFSLPWEIDSIDQLIGRIDRLGTEGDGNRSIRTIDIWRILLEGSQEAAIADVVGALGVFDAPLPPLSPDELLQVQVELDRAALGWKSSGAILPLASGGTGLPTLLAAADPYTSEQAAADFKKWRALPLPEPAMMTDLAGRADTPVRREERALGAWLKTIARSEDFDIGSRPDNTDDYRFKTIWYHRLAATGRAGESPFMLPGVGRDCWMSDHLPFIYRRSDISAPPRKAVVTDEGEDKARPLHFLDHGSAAHDAIVSGYANATRDLFGPESPVVQASAVLPDGHPARGIGSLVFLTVAALDPFPDELLPPLWSSEAEKILAAAPTEAQRNALTADRKALQTLFLAAQRRIRLEAPAKMLRNGAAKGPDGWKKMPPEQVDLCLRPLTSSTNNAIAKGRNVQTPHLKPETAKAVRTRCLEQFRADAQHFNGQVLDRVRPALELIMMQVFSHFKTEAANRELALERHIQSPPDGGLVELWQGQVAARERSLAMAHLNSIEATTLLQKFAAGRITIPQPKSRSILIALVDNF